MSIALSQALSILISVSVSKNSIWILIYTSEVPCDETKHFCISIFFCRSVAKFFSVIYGNVFAIDKKSVSLGVYSVFSISNLSANSATLRADGSLYFALSHVCVKNMRCSKSNFSIRSITWSALYLEKIDSAASANS
ncbi:hypothetical protein D3C81_1363840 [compost metagenome]